MKRTTALQQLAQQQLLQLSEEDRALHLEALLLENWETEEAWLALAPALLNEFRGTNLTEAPSSKRYDAPLLVKLQIELYPVSNTYLEKQLQVTQLEGSPIAMESCPCCGRKTLEHKADFEICRVCWWEDDGQDNDKAAMTAGPNAGISLTQARYNFLTFGIYNPKREDLKAIQEEACKYPLGRVFKVEGKCVIEPLSQWKGSLHQQL